MRTNTKKLFAIALVAVMMASAGCTGWGTDGPADSEPNQSDDSNASDDLEETQNETNASEGDSSHGSDTSTSSGGDDTTNSDGAPDDTDDSSDGAPSDQSDGDSSAEGTDATGDSDAEPQGSSGDDSSADSDGSDGADGSDGSDGSNGADGSDDSNGDDGAGGSNGGDGDGGSGSGDEQLTCDAFDTQPEAQAYYDEAPEERGHLDANNDDIPCESLPGGDSSGGDNGDDPDPVGASLTVTVEDQEGNAVEGIEVVGIGPDAEIYSATTNADGQATYDSLPAGDYEYHVTTDGTDYEETSTESISLDDGDDESLTVTVTDTGGGEPTPDEETTLTVEVVDDETGEPIDSGEIEAIFAGWGYGFTAPIEDGTATFETSDEGIPTVGDDGSDSAEVEFNANVEGYEIDEERTNFSTVIDLQEDNSHTLNLVAEESEPPANETEPGPNETLPNGTPVPNEPAPNESVSAV